ncbi:hypothetical protein HPB47_023807, partial [Ixodes persulcatus]
MFGAAKHLDKHQPQLLEVLAETDNLPQRRTSAGRCECTKIISKLEAQLALSRDSESKLRAELGTTERKFVESTACNAPKVGLFVWCAGGASGMEAPLSDGGALESTVTALSRLESCGANGGEEVASSPASALPKGREGVEVEGCQVQDPSFIGHPLGFPLVFILVFSP